MKIIIIIGFNFDNGGKKRNAHVLDVCHCGTEISIFQY